MAPTLYAIDASPPCRAVYLCAKAIDLDLNIDQGLNFFDGDHLKPEYLEKNPQHTVPLLDDDGFNLPDSHAIMTYLVSKYAKGSPLYPQDLKQRAVIDHKLHFDSSVLFIRGLHISKPLLFLGEKVDAKKLAPLEDAYAITEQFLDKTPYIAGDQLTVADFSFVTSLTSWQIFLPISEAKYPKITAWIKKLEKLPYYKEANLVGLKDYFNMVKAKLAE